MYEYNGYVYGDSPILRRASTQLSKPAWFDIIEKVNSPTKFEKDIRRDGQDFGLLQSKCGGVCGGDGRC